MALSPDRVVLCFIQKLKLFLTYLATTFKNDFVISQHISDVVLFADANPKATYNLYKDGVFRKYQQAIDECDEGWVTKIAESEARAAGTLDLFKRVFNSQEVNDVVKAETFRHMIVLGNICRSDDH